MYRWNTHTVQKVKCGIGDLRAVNCRIDSFGIRSEKKWSYNDPTTFSMFGMTIFWIAIHFFGSHSHILTAEPTHTHNTTYVHEYLWR